MKYALFICAFFGLILNTSAQTRSQAHSQTQKKMMDAYTALWKAQNDQLTLCHKVHTEAVDEADRMPWRSPLSFIKQYSDAKQMTDDCVKLTRQTTTQWQGLSDAVQKQQEKILGRELGFSFDDVIDDYNFFNVVSSYLKNDASQ